MYRPKLTKSKWLLIATFLIPVVLVLKQLFWHLSDIAVQTFNDQEKFAHHYSYFVDSSGQLTASEALKQTFIPCDDCNPPFEFGDIQYWHKLTVANTDTETLELTLFLDNPMVDTIKVYQLDNDELTLKATLGDQIPYENHELYALPHHNFQLAHGASKQFLISSKTTGAPYLPILVIQQEYFSEHKDISYLLWGAFIGAILLMSMYNLILYQGVQESLFVYYVAYIFLFLFELGIVHGFLVYLFPQEGVSWLANQVIAINFLLSYTTLIFAQKFLRFGPEDGWIYSAGQYLAYLLLAGTAFSLVVIEYKAAQIYFVGQAALYVIAFIMLANRLNSHFKWAKFYFISWAPLFIGAVIGPLLLTGHLEYNFWTRHALLLGVMFEMTFISLALAERLKISEKQRHFQAFHNQLLGIANLNWLENLFSRKDKREQQSHTLLLVSVNNYQAISPYLDPDMLSPMFTQFLRSLVSKLELKFELLDVANETPIPQAAAIRENLFVVIIPGDQKSALEGFIAKQQIDWCYNFVTTSLSVNLGSSFGLCVHDNSKSFNDSINQAAHALNIALTSDKLLEVYTDKSEQDKRREISLAADLLQAIADNQLSLYHQPKMNIVNNQVAGSEVLLRWKHPEYGYVSPAEFVTIAENTGAINMLSQWVISQTIVQLQLLEQRGYHNYQVSINLSALDLANAAIIEFLIEECQIHNISPEQIIVELTETISISEKSVVDQHLIKLRELGFGVAIDDFGTGYSSFSYVNKDIFSELKIDRQFIDGISNSKQQTVIVKSILKMSQNLGLRVIAEGAETVEDIAKLQQLKCYYVQGYVIAKPMPFEQYFEWLTKQQLSGIESHNNIIDFNNR